MTIMDVMGAAKAVAGGVSLQAAQKAHPALYGWVSTSGSPGL